MANFIINPEGTGKSYIEELTIQFSQNQEELFRNTAHEMRLSFFTNTNIKGQGILNGSSERILLFLGQARKNNLSFTF